MRKNLVMLLLLLLVGLSGTAYGQQPGSPPAQDSKHPSPGAQENKLPATPQKPILLTAQGVLFKIDSQKQLIWIKSNEGQEMQFSYNKETKVEGASNTVEGLAKMTASELKVHFRIEGSTNIAVGIEVLTGKT